VAVATRVVVVVTPGAAVTVDQAISVAIQVANPAEKVELQATGVKAKVAKAKAVKVKAVIMAAKVTAAIPAVTGAVGMATLMTTR
jgi:hypothetical protein